MILGVDPLPEAITCVDRVGPLSSPPVTKYVNSDRHWPPDRLKITFGQSEPGQETPFAELDSLYHLILSFVADTEKLQDFLMFLASYPSSNSTRANDKKVYIPYTLIRADINTWIHSRRFIYVVNDTSYYKLAFDHLPTLLSRVKVPPLLQMHDIILGLPSLYSITNHPKDPLALKKIKAMQAIEEFLKVAS